MAEGPLFAGPTIRRLRKREGLTQAAMAARLSISPSYLNLIERNQRPLSARVVVQVVERFDFDPRSLREDESIGGIDGLARRLSDERFSDLGIDRDEVGEFLAAAPQAAAAFARLFDNAGDARDQDDEPLQASRREIERWRNHFTDLDSAAEALSDELRLSRADIGGALSERLQNKHQLSIRILPQDVMMNAVRRLDLHARQLQLSEMLDSQARNFQVAMQLAQLEQREAIENLAAGAQFTDGAARQLFERHLTGYFAAALIMPYSRFLRACEATGYDLQVLMRRFGVSLEQLAHRLTTLQRVGQRGLPFFMGRIDRAGQFSKRFAGASGATLLEGNASCPLWVPHSAFEWAGQWCRQVVHLPEAGVAPADWLTIARTVEGSFSDGVARFAIILGLESRLAGNLAPSRDLSLRQEDAQAIGPGCAACHIQNCRQRSLPPRGTQLHFDRISHGDAPFRFG
jgi:predicted transcriptional regulator/DNA-binding XRE family transcriptional regulator